MRKMSRSSIGRRKAQPGSGSVAAAQRSGGMTILMSAILSWIVVGGDVAGAWECENECGGIALSYPFGSGPKCGSPEYAEFVNCTRNRLYFHTPTGRYEVRAIDYGSGVMIVTDPGMATCETEGTPARCSFGLPVGAPFAFAPDNTIALVGCASLPSLYARGACQASPSSSSSSPSPSPSQICRSLYGPSCSSGVAALVGGPSSSSDPTASCCVASQLLLNSAPFELDLALLQCESYSSAYRIGDVHDPLHTWLFGIALQFNPGPNPGQAGAGAGANSADQSASCYICQQALDSSATAIHAPQIRILSGLLTALVLGALGIVISA